MRNVMILALCFFAGLQTTIYAQGTGNLVKAVVVDDHNVKWFGTDLGLLSFDGINWKAYKVHPEQPGKVTSIDYAIAEGLLIGTHQGYMEAKVNAAGIKEAYIYNTLLVDEHVQVSQNAITSVNKSKSLNHVNAVMYDQNLTKYAITDEGMVVWNADQIIWLMNDFPGLDVGLTRGIHTSMSYENDSIYIGSTKGVGRLFPKTWKYAYYDENNGNELVVTNSDIDGYTGASHYTKEWGGIISNDVLSVFTDSKGFQWFGTADGISLHTTPKWDDGWDLTLTMSDGLINNTVHAIFEDSGGDLWFGTDGGVSKYDIPDSSFSSYTTTDGLSDNMIYDIAEDQDNILWFATANGVTSYNGSTFTTYNTGDQATDFVSVIVNSITPATTEKLPFRVYPNPASAYIYIHFTGYQDRYVEVQAYDMSGKKVRDIYSGYTGAGDLKTRWNLGDDNEQPLPSGIYFIQLDDGDKVYTRKAVVLH